MENKQIISFEASTRLKEALRLAAFNKSMTISALIRRILEEALTKELAQVNKNDRSK